MIRKIDISQLRLGMHVHELGGSWLDHSFWRTKFTLERDADLQSIRSSGVTELWIDTAQGLDVLEPGQEISAVAGMDAGALATATSTAPGAPAVAVPKPQAPMAHAEALDHAAAIYKRSLPQITSMFGEARLGRAVDPDDFGSMVDEISDSVLRNPGALISVTRLKRRDEYTYMHSVAVCALMVSLGRELGLEGEQLRQVGLAGMLHDLGKALVPLDVLNKPGKLTDEEFKLMKAHPQHGHNLLVEGGSASDLVLDVCLHHHEKMDGSGYPDQLKDEQISLFARMGAVCDVYDAVTSVRPYKNAWDPGMALRTMAQWTGHFDSRVFQAFVKAMGIYPIGSLVRLQSGRLAVVTGQHPQSLLKPLVKAFFSTKSNLRIEPEELDLAHPDCKDKVVAGESPADWPFKDLDQLWGAPVLA